MRRTSDTRPPTRSDAEDTLRVFFALWPDVGARDALAVLARDVAARRQGRAAVAGNLHMTLAFLGDVGTARITALHAIGAAAASAVSPFTLTLDQVGAFRGAGITWAGTSAPPTGLLQLVQRLGDALAAEGFAIERRAFHPHLTLARRCRRPGSRSITTQIAWIVARMTLHASELSSAEPRYLELAGWPLGMRAVDDQVS